MAERKVSQDQEEGQGEESQDGVGSSDSAGQSRQKAARKKLVKSTELPCGLCMSSLEPDQSRPVQTSQASQIRRLHCFT